MQTKHHIKCSEYSLVNKYKTASFVFTEAIAALNTLKPTDITLVKSMKNPPDTVKLVMAAVCVMKDIKPEKVLDPNNPGKRVTRTFYSVIF